MQALLFGTTPTDPVGLLVALLVLAAGALAASVPPTLRATRVDPAQTLRFE